MAYGVVGLIFVVEMAVTFWDSGYIEGLNKKADKYKEAAITEADANTITPGDIYDRNDTVLVENAEPGQNSIYIDDYAYSQVLGYTGPARIIYGEEISKSQRQYRLMEYYRDQLYGTQNLDATEGNSLVLTLDHELQMKVYELLMQEVGEGNRGSAIVMDAKTAEILAMVSLPSFNANDLDSSISQMNQAPSEQEIFYPISHKGLAVPGSIFKVITAVSLLDNGLEDFTVADQSFSVEDRNVVNSYGNIGDEINYYTAIERSSNVFFARAGLELGGEKLEETAKKFMIGQDLELDLGTVSSNWGLDPEDSNDLADTSYGQGKTLFSTIYGAMEAQTIANDGIMMEPYIIKEIRTPKGRILEKGEADVLSEVTGRETADKITEAMLAATASHISVVEGEENQEIYQRYSIASKTGTGENGDQEETNNAWLISFAPAEDPEYVVVVNQCKTQKFGQDMMDTAAQIYRYLFQER